MGTTRRGAMYGARNDNGITRRGDAHIALTGFLPGGSAGYSVQASRTWRLLWAFFT